MVHSMILRLICEVNLLRKSTHIPINQYREIKQNASLKKSPKQSLRNPTVIFTRFNPYLKRIKNEI